MNANRIDCDTKIVVVQKSGETYVWMYDSWREREMLRSVGRMAADEELSLT